MTSMLKDMMDGVDSKSPFVIASERGTGFVPNLVPGHFFALSTTHSYEIDESVLPRNRFEYNEKRDEQFFISKEPYYDEKPIGLCLHINNSQYTSILNLKVLPPLYRYKILETYYQVTKQAIEVGYESDLSKEKMTIAERLRENNYIAPFLGVTKSLMEQMTGIDLGFAINKYKITDLQDVKLLDWDSLPEIAKMQVTETGITFHPSAGGLEGMFNIFESRLA